jgi:hypothetical protein
MGESIRYEQARSVLAEIIALQALAAQKATEAEAAEKSALTELAMLNGERPGSNWVNFLTGLGYRRLARNTAEEQALKASAERRRWLRAGYRADAEKRTIAEMILLAEQPAYVALANYIAGLREIAVSAERLRLFALNGQGLVKPWTFNNAYAMIAAEIDALSKLIHRHDVFCVECVHAGYRYAVAPWRKADFSGQVLLGRQLTMPELEKLAVQIETEARRVLTSACADGQRAVERLLSSV